MLSVSCEMDGEVAGVVVEESTGSSSLGDLGVIGLTGDFLGLRRS